MALPAIQAGIAALGAVSSIVGAQRRREALEEARRRTENEPSAARAAGDRLAEQMIGASTARPGTSPLASLRQGLRAGADASSSVAEAAAREETARQRMLGKFDVAAGKQDERIGAIAGQGLSTLAGALSFLGEDDDDEEEENGAVGEAVGAGSAALTGGAGGIARDLFGTSRPGSEQPLGMINNEQPIAPGTRQLFVDDEQAPGAARSRLSDRLGVRQLFTHTPESFQSDEEIKNEIEDAGFDVEEFLDALRARRFRREGSGREQIGVVAQELEQSEAGRRMVNEGPGGVREVDTSQAVQASMAGLGNLNERLSALEEAIGAESGIQEAGREPTGNRQFPEPRVTSRIEGLDQVFSPQYLAAAREQWAEFRQDHPEEARTIMNGERPSRVDRIRTDFPEMYRVMGTVFPSMRPTNELPPSPEEPLIDTSPDEPPWRRTRREPSTTQRTPQRSRERPSTTPTPPAVPPSWPREDLEAAVREGGLDAEFIAREIAAGRMTPPRSTRPEDIWRSLREWSVRHRGVQLEGAR